MKQINISLLLYEIINPRPNLRKHIEIVDKYRYNMDYHLFRRKDSNDFEQIKKHVDRAYKINVYIEINQYNRPLPLKNNKYFLDFPFD